MNCKYLIGIAGRDGAGKDTVGIMLSYLFNYGATSAKYDDYREYEQAYKSYYLKNVIHFADNVKDSLSSLFDIKRELLDVHSVKNETFFCIENKKLYSKEMVDKNKMNVITLPFAIEFGFELSMKGGKNVILVRDLMKYYANEVCKKHLYRDIFVKNTIFKAKEVLSCKNSCMISDVRFYNESEAIRYCKEYSTFIIYITRNDKDGCNYELDKIKYDFTLENDSNEKFPLFYKVIDIYNAIINGEKCNKGDK